MLADARYCLPLPADRAASELAPLLCAGLIGYRAYCKAHEGTQAGGNLGIYGFGAAAHLIAQVARHDGRQVFAFTREGDEAGQHFARSLGAVWAGASGVIPPEPLDAALLFAPVGALIPAALAAVRPGGRVVCAGIHMSDVPSFPYRLLWGERTLCSVANLTRADGEAFLAIAARLALKPTVECFPLHEANRALERLRNGALTGAAVLAIPRG
jgi:alcohol dehydrogenase, propanol-preferring